MAGTLNVDTLKADSNLKLQIASANVAFIDVNGLTIVGNSLNVGGGRIVVTSNNSISTPSVIGANLVTVSGTTALGITANGQITTANAPFILTGGQIQFPGTQIASGDGNCLDDYEEGTFTATLTPTGGSLTMDTSRQTLQYVKIGKIVTIMGYIRTNTVSSPTGPLSFNLPFTSTAGTQYSGQAVGVAIPENLLSGNSNGFAITLDAGAATAKIQYTAGGGTAASWSAVGEKFGSICNVTINLTYMAVS